MTVRHTVSGALVLLVAALSSGCGDNSGNPAGFEPKGTGDAALLLVDVQPANADSSEVLVYGEIYDPSSANGFRLYVDPGNQGYRPAADYLAAPNKTFSTGVNGYRIRALDSDITLDNVYLGRGARNGFETAAAPLTEHAVVNRGFTPIDLARRLDVTLLSPPDSAFFGENTIFNWSPVPGAARYRFYATGRDGIVFEIILGLSGENIMLIEDLPLSAGLYHWGVDAIDVQNRVIGITRHQRALLL